ncbi:hypothetical protein F3Y22_tig00110551pilonHSYRG00241 [Hibiscus syriacus]|uniref:Reverse transcriptase domain-containing protein n=1 Tax=Hibiscus syriacus TaxID=106335 RepID=A0A6A3A908_HIBSY|nr:hypothetical protein F3Y22_tig00110551pilonHSYRG00241 [Hibiscus syriacus]
MLQVGISLFLERSYGGEKVVYGKDDRQVFWDRRAEWMNLWFDELELMEGYEQKLKIKVWVILKDVHILVWSDKFFKELGSSWGTIISIHEETSRRDRFDEARLLLKVQYESALPEKCNIIVNGRVYTIRIIQRSKKRAGFSLMVLWPVVEYGKQLMWQAADIGVCNFQRDTKADVGEGLHEVPVLSNEGPVYQCVDESIGLMELNRVIAKSWLSQSLSNRSRLMDVPIEKIYSLQILVEASCDETRGVNFGKVPTSIIYAPNLTLGNTVTCSTVGGNLISGNPSKHGKASKRKNKNASGCSLMVKSRSHPNQSENSSGGNQGGCLDLRNKAEAALAVVEALGVQFSISREMMLERLELLEPSGEWTLPRSLSDHKPVMLRGKKPKKVCRPFKWFNYSVEDPSFFDRIKGVCEANKALRGRTNHISSLKVHNSMYKNQSGIQNAFIKYFQESYNDVITLPVKRFDISFKRITEATRRFIEAPFTEEEGKVENFSFNKSFIALIPKKSEVVATEDFRPISLIMDCALIANKIIDELRKSKKDAILFKADFSKTYDIVDFSEALNGLLKKSVMSGSCGGVFIGSGVVVSHIQVADDIIFFSEANVEKIKNLLRVLKIFEVATGLKLNMKKKKLYGINVEESRVIGWAESISCGWASLPTTYLGLPLCEDSDCLWKKIIVARNNYDPELILPRAVNNGKSSWVWRDIINPTALYEDGFLSEVRCVMCNGAKIDFWTIALNWTQSVKWQLQVGIWSGLNMYR